MSDSQLPSALHQYLQDLDIAPLHVVPLTGDASDRRYFRVFLADRPPLVLALYATPFDASTLPFMNVATLFAALPVPIPRVLGVAGPLGILALEDLGDATLQAHLGGATTDERDALYRRAVAHIITIQVRGEALRDDKYLPYGLAFDVGKLTWEMDFFVKHFLENYRGLELAETTRQTLRAELGRIAADVAALPRVLCHRDYHSRNLMVHRDELFVIDFQDARMGPATYDLVSLLRDSYVDLPEPLVDELIDSFAARIGQDTAAFRAQFDLMALQRNLKALGTFGYQATARGNPVYGQYVPRTIGYVRHNLSRNPRFAAVGAELASLVPELR
ncbi:MAG: phosphotransferase [Vicinamibacterales bacterium]